MKKKRTPSIEPTIKPTVNVIVDPLGNEGLIKNGLIAWYDPGWQIKNLCPSDVGSWEQGSFAGDGSVAALTSRLRTINFQTVNQLLNYTFSVSSGYIARSVFYYNNGVYLSKSADNSIQSPLTVTIPAGCNQVKLAIAKANLTDTVLPSEIPTIQPVLIEGAFPQSLTDRSGKGNHAQLGSTSGSDTNDPSFTGSGVLFGLDDYLKCTQNAFDDMAQFTCITVCNPLSYGGLGAGKIFDKTARTLSTLSSPCLRFRQIRSVSFDDWLGNSSTLLKNNVFGVMYANGNADNGPVMWQNGNKLVVTRNSTGSGAISSDANNDLIIGNNAASSTNFDGAIYLQVWYNRILSDTEYLQTFNYLKKLMASRGITI